MRRLILILMVLMWWPLAASAQMVSPGGGNYTGAIIGGQCTNPEFMQGITSTGFVTCATPAGGGGGGAVPPGDVPQVIGYSATNVGAAMTITGDMTLAAGAAGTYIATVTQINGAPAGPLATATVGNGLTLTGGALGLTVPVSVANGGTGYTGTATSPQILIAQTTGAFHPETMSGDATIAANGAVIVNSVHGVAGPFMVTTGPTYTGTMTGGSINLSGSLTFNGTAVGGTCPTGQLMNSLSATLVPGCVPISSGNGIIINNGVISLAAPVTVANGGLGSVAITPAAGMIPVALNATNYVARTVSGDGTLSSTGVLTVTQLNGTVPGGSCTAGSFVTSLNSSAVPTCGANLGTLYAPLVNPPSGQNNYASINSPTFNSPSFTGTMTFPDGSTYTTAGHNNMKSLGIGAPASTITGSMFVAEHDWNGSTTGLMSNKTAGANSQTVLYFNNDVSATTNSYGALGMTSSTFTAGGPLAPGDSFDMLTAGAGGIVISSGASTTTAPIYLDVAGANIATIRAVAGSGQDLMDIYGNQNADSNLTVWNTSAGGNASASLYVWNGTSGASLEQTSTGYTANPAFAPNTSVLASTGAGGTTLVNFAGGPQAITRFWVGGTWAAYIEPQALVFPNTNYSQIQFGQYGAPTASILGYSNTGALHVTAGAYWNSSAWTTNVNNAEDISWNPTPPIGNIDIMISPYQAPGAINWATVGRFEFSSLSAGPVQGLDLSGYANRVGTGEGVASLTVGNSYQSGTGWANWNVSGASYPINNGTGWQADCGAGSGVAMFAINANHLYMYSSGAYGCNAGFNWTNIAGWAVTGMSVNHIENNTQHGVPSVSSGSLVQGSRDMFGWIVGVKGGETTLTFSENFAGESNCTLTAAGRPNLWFDAGQAVGQVTFACVVPWTGDPCPDDSWVEYHCFGQGDPVAQSRDDPQTPANLAARAKFLARVKKP